MMMNNPLPLLINAVKNGGNPAAIIQQMAKNNPQMAQAARMINGKSPQQLQRMALNMCRERGVSPDDILRQLGIS